MKKESYVATALLVLAAGSACFEVAAGTASPESKTEALGLVKKSVQSLEQAGFGGSGPGFGEERPWVHAAELLARAGETNAAWQTLKRAAQMAEATTNLQALTAVLTKLAEAQVKLGDTNGASATWQAAVRSCQRGPERQSLRDVAESQLNSGDKAGALKTCVLELERIQTIDPNAMPDVWRRDIAVIQARAGDLNGALNVARGMGATEYKDHAFTLIARAAAESGDFDFALKAAQEMRGEGFVMSLAEIARSKAKKGDAKGAMSLVKLAEKSLAQKAEPAEQQGGLVLSAVAAGAAEGGHFPAALEAAKQLRQAQQKDYILLEIATQQAKAGKTNDARQTLRLVGDARNPRPAQQLAAMEMAAGNYAGAQKSIQLVTDRQQQARALWMLATAQAKAAQTNAAKQTLEQAAATALQIDTSVQDYRNLFQNKLNLLCLIARSQHAAGDIAAARQLLLKGVELAGKASGGQDRFAKAMSLQSIAQAQADVGDWKGALETIQVTDTIGKADAHWGVGPGTSESLLASIALARARDADVQGALAMAEAEKSASRKAAQLLGVAEAMLDRSGG